MDSILSLVSVISTAAVSLFSVALPQILESRRAKRDFLFKQTQLYLDNKFSVYQNLISAYAYPHFDANRLEARLKLKRAIFLAISVSDPALSTELQNLLLLVDEPAATFHQTFQPAFVRCLSLISREYTATVESMYTCNKSESHLPRE